VHLRLLKVVKNTKAELKQHIGSFTLTAALLNESNDFYTLIKESAKIPQYLITCITTELQACN